jgi:hypothetical protein
MFSNKKCYLFYVKHFTEANVFWLDKKFGQDNSHKLDISKAV